jgi:hypothetical protein
MNSIKKEVFGKRLSVEASEWRLKRGTRISVEELCKGGDWAQ